VLEAMCGIADIAPLCDDPSSATLKAMAAAQRHRGPDDRGMC